MAAKLFGSIAVVIALTLAGPGARAADPYGAAPPLVRPDRPLSPAPRAPIAELAPYLNSHPSGADLRGFPQSIDDYRYLRSRPPTIDAFTSGIIAREPTLPWVPEPVPAPRAERPCSASWNAANACLLRLEPLPGTP